MPRRQITAVDKCRLLILALVSLLDVDELARAAARRA
jgi:hypothetical protein